MENSELGNSDHKDVKTFHEREHEGVNNGWFIAKDFD